MHARKCNVRAANGKSVARFFLWAFFIFRLSAADAPATSPAPQLQPVQYTTSGSVDTAPSEDRLQGIAPEIIDLTITTVETQPLTGNSVPNGALSVSANATVLSVLRSASKLKSGDQIKIVYNQIPPQPGKNYPLPIPAPKNGTEYIAYLIGSVDNTYAPIAGSRSFADIAKPDQIVLPPDAVQRGALINPKLLPMPQNPSPTGVVKLSGDKVKNWAEVSQTNGKWQVLLREFKEPLPLRTIGNATPEPLAYYLKPVIAPLTQPTVLVYRAGIEDSGNPALGTLTVERALIIDAKGRLLGDTLWARRTNKNVLIPLPDWNWLSFKLEVQDSMSHATQNISLISTEDPADKK